MKNVHSMRVGFGIRLLSLLIPVFFLSIAASVDAREFEIAERGLGDIASWVSAAGSSHEPYLPHVLSYVWEEVPQARGILRDLFAWADAEKGSLGMHSVVAPEDTEEGEETATDAVTDEDRSVATEKPQSSPAATATTSTAIPAVAGTVSSSSLRGMVSIDFDDGWRSAYENAVPILDDAGMRGTFYVVTGYANEGFPAYMSWSHIEGLAEAGYEIGAHTVTHPHLTHLSESRLREELTGSKDDLTNHGLSTEAFAYPYGDIDFDVKNTVRETGFASGRGIGGCLNGNNSDRYNLCAHSLTSQTVFEEVKANIDTAIAENTWYIMALHRVDEFNSGDHYTVSSELIRDIVQYLKSTGVPVVTASAGVRRMESLGSAVPMSISHAASE